MQLIKRHSIVFLLAVLIISCKNSEEQKIYGVVINKIIMPTPPPPPNAGENKTLNKQIIDSLKKVKLNVAVFPLKYKFTNPNFSEIKKIYKKAGVTYIQSLTPINSSDLLKVRKSIVFDILNKTREVSGIDFKKTDGVLFFSEIVFNSNNTEAFVLVAYTRGKLSSSTVIYLLKKENDKWKITDSKRISVS